MLAVTKDELRDADTSTTPTFLGLSAPGGLWEQLGGADSAGEDIIIGIIDSRHLARAPSASPTAPAPTATRKDGKLGYQQIPGWHGKCEPGEAVQRVPCATRS